MSLDIPNLDAKNFEILLEEAISKLPSNAPSWTNYNLSDPGITLIELFAWLNDINYYRLNRVNTKHRDGFLKLVGLNKEDSIGANVLLSFTSDHDIPKYNSDKDIGILKPKNVVIVSKGTEVLHDDLCFVTQNNFVMYPIDFEIISLQAKEYGDAQEIQRENFYPFGKTFQEDFYFLIHLSHVITQNFSFYIQTQNYSDETIPSEMLDGVLLWQCYDESLDSWVKIESLNDESNLFTKSGNISLSLPIPSSKIRCTLKNSSFYESVPLVKKILLNTVLAQQEDRHKTFLGKSNGYVNQSFILKASPLKETLKVKVGRENWNEVKHLKTQDSEAKVFQVENENLLFGDGKYGKIPPKDLDIHCEYLSNAGSLGNLTKNSLFEAKKIKSYGGSVVVNNYDGAWGGKDSPTQTEMFNSFQNSLKSVHRAVSLSDYEYLALHTPHTQLVKVKAHANPKKNQVSLILIPKSDSPKPQVTQLTKDKVSSYLDKKRLLTTSVKIEDANYQEVHINLGIFSTKQDPVTLEKKIIETLDNYLHPITGGKDSKGWSFGESLYLSSLYTLISTIDGIDNIEVLKINSSESTLLEVPQDTLISGGKYFIYIQGLDPVSCRI